MGLTALIFLAPCWMLFNPQCSSIVSDRWLLVVFATHPLYPPSGFQSGGSHTASSFQLRSGSLRPFGVLCYSWGIAACSQRKRLKALTCLPQNCGPSLRADPPVSPCFPRTSSTQSKIKGKFQNPDRHSNVTFSLHRL